MTVDETSYPWHVGDIAWASVDVGDGDTSKRRFLPVLDAHGSLVALVRVDEQETQTQVKNLRVILEASRLPHEGSVASCVG